MLKLQPSSSENSVVAAIRGSLSQTEYDELVESLESQCNIFGSARLLLDVQEVSAADEAFVWQDIQHAIRHLTDLSVVAVVGQASYEDNFIERVFKFVDCQTAFFAWTDMAAACSWLAPENQMSPDLHSSEARCL